MSSHRRHRSHTRHPCSHWGRLLCLTLLVAPGLAAGATVGWTDWTERGGDWLVGRLTLSDGTGVEVRYDGELFGSRIDGGMNYWIPESTFVSDAVDHGPPTGDMAVLAGGDESLHTLTFTPPVLDPVVAVVSVGRPNLLVEYRFDRPFTLLSSGGDYWSPEEDSRLVDSGPNDRGGDTLRGWEGSGTLQFAGVVEALSWTIPLREGWHGLTVGAAKAPVPEPPAFALCLTVVAGLLGARFHRRRG